MMIAVSSSMINEQYKSHSIHVDGHYSDHYSCCLSIYETWCVNDIKTIIGYYLFIIS